MRLSSLVLMTGVLLVAADYPKDDKKAKTDLDTRTCQADDKS
jgi:hypothetical protein